MAINVMGWQLSEAQRPFLIFTEGRVRAEASQAAIACVEAVTFLWLLGTPQLPAPVMCWRAAQWLVSADSALVFLLPVRGNFTFVA